MMYPMRAERFEFACQGVALVGDLYAPSNPVAAAVLTGPLTSVKEQASGAYARALAERGIAALAFDHRTFGGSGGEPRQFENPFAKVDDIRSAADALRADQRYSHLPIFGVGICAGGGYMAGAVSGDARFAGFAGVAGYYSALTEQSLAASAAPIARGEAAERNWRETGVSETIPAVGPPGAEVAMPLAEAFAYYGTARGAKPSYVNAFAIMSRAYNARFNSIGYAAGITQRALIVHSEKALAPQNARAFLAALAGQHAEVWLQSEGQIDFYDNPSLIGAACDAIVRELLPNLSPQGAHA